MKTTRTAPLRLALLAALIALLVSACATTPPAPVEQALLLQGPHEPARFEAVLQPQVNEQSEVTAIAVDSIIYGSLVEDAERLKLTAPIVYAGAFGIAERMQQISVTDQQGAVQLEVTDDPEAPGGFPYFRHWTAQRAVSFPVRVSYQTAVEPPTDRRGPPFNIKASNGGVSGAGVGFLLIPENVDSDFSRVRWDLREFPRFSSGISAFGTEAFELAGPPADLMQGWYMAGPVGRYPDLGDAGGFSAAWLGDYPFDPSVAMQEVAESYRWLSDYFGYLSPPPRYRVFMRIIDSPQTRFSGTALTDSFMLSGGPNSGAETNGEAPQSTFFHEMIHMWVGLVEGPQGVSSWFSEGLTSYYTLVLPVRGGFDSLDDYHLAINRLARAYFTSPAINMSAEDIAKVGFGDEAIRSTPYSRGAIYFADLDARIRRVSNGERELNDLMRKIFEQRHTNPDYHFDHAAWQAALAAELGPEAAAEFDARILQGEPMLPDSDAFGPCFERQAKTYTVESKSIPGYEWIRKPGVSDEQCWLH